MIRRPAVAGRFYAADPDSLRRDLVDITQGLRPERADRASALLVVISSDMSHYLPREAAESEDRKAIDRLLALDPGGLHRVVLTDRISMCGIAPAVAGLEAARQLGARQARLIAYATSGDRSGDYQSVVGYAGI